MSLPAWNRKAPSRAAIAATLSALTVFGASSVATADVSQNPYQQPAFGYGFQGQQQLPAAPYGPGFGYGPQPASFAAPAQAIPQGYAQPAPQGYGQPAPQLPGYGLPQQVPGYGLPGGYPIPGAPAPGFGPYGGGFPDYGFSSQWGNFAPSEPNYAPHERAGAKAPAPVAAAAAPAPAPARAPAAPAPAKAGTKPAPASATTSDYSYEIAPTTNSTYVGSSTQYGSAPTTYADPYQSIANQQSGSTGFQVTTPSYTTQYDATTTTSSYPEAAPAQDYSGYVSAPEYNVAPSYTAPAATPSYTSAPNYTVAAPAPQAPVNTGGYEYQGATSYETATPSYQQPAQQTYQQAAPSYQQPAQQSYQQAAPSYQQSPQSYEQAPADYYDLSASAAAAAAAVAAPTYEVAAYAPPQQATPRGGHFVQVGAFLNEARAARLVNKLGASGQQAFIVPAQVRGRLYHRVRISGGSKRNARAIRNQVRELGYYEARVVKG